MRSNIMNQNEMPSKKEDKKVVKKKRMILDYFLKGIYLIIYLRLLLPSSFYEILHISQDISSLIEKNLLWIVLFLIVFIAIWKIIVKSFSQAINSLIWYSFLGVVIKFTPNLYVFIYTIVILIYLIVLLKKTTPLYRVLKKLTLNIWFQLGVFGFTFLLWFVILRIDNNIFLTVSSILLIISIIATMIFIFLWVRNPLSVLYQIYQETARKIIWYFINLDHKNIVKKKEEKEEIKKEKKESSIKTYKKWEDLFINIGLFFKKFSTKPTILDVFLILFLFCVFVCVISFGYEYYIIQNIDPMSFQGIENAGIFEYIYFSFLIFLTIDISNIVPLTKIAKYYILFEALSIIFFITILITRFSLLTVERAESQYKEEIREKLLEDVTKIREYITDIERL